MNSIVNGKVQNTISIHDRGLLYGDGVFETIAIHHGEPRYWPRHMARLREGCRRLKIHGIDYDVLRSEADMLCRSETRGVLKVIVTRGSGGRGYRAPSSDDGATGCTRILQRHDFPNYPKIFWQEGVELTICNSRLGGNPSLAGLKHLNRLEQVIARSEWHNSLIPEGLMLNQAGDVISGTMTNLFVVREKNLYTPDLSQCGVAGVIRGLVIDIARSLGISVYIDRLSLSDVLSSDEVFVCNSLVHIWPVSCIGDVRWRPGVITRHVAEVLDTWKNG